MARRRATRADGRGLISITWGSIGLQTAIQISYKGLVEQIRSSWPAMDALRSVLRCETSTRSGTDALQRGCALIPALQLMILRQGASFLSSLHNVFPKDREAEDVIF